MKHPLADRVAIVTGGGSGIGRATCLALAAAGARVAVVGRDPARIGEVVGRLPGTHGARTEHLGLVLDVRVESDMAAMVERTLARFGAIDALITCAAVLRPPAAVPKPLAETPLAEWRFVLDTNLLGVFFSNRAVAKVMIGEGRGTIINVASVSAIRGRAHDSPYCASKFAVVALSRSLAAELCGHGVRVHVVYPDATDTPIWAQNRPVPKPRHVIPPSRVAQAILHALALPGDSVIPSAVVAPLMNEGLFRGRGGGLRGDTGQLDDRTARLPRC